MSGVDGASAAAAKAAGSLIGVVARSLHRQVRPDTSRTALNRVSDDLADAVFRQETMMRDQLRSGPDRSMDLSFGRVSSEDLADAAVLGTQPALGRYFGKLPAPARLVILGDVGSGKTVMANHLVLDLLERRANLPDSERSQQPVPLRVNMADWSAQYDLTTWITRRIGTDYRLHPRTAGELVGDPRRILPVLDGLDQMDIAADGARRACMALDHLNETPWCNRPVILTCRTEIYRRVQELRGDAGLHGAVVIGLRRLTAAAVMQYLDTQCRHIGVRDDRCAALVDTIRAEPGGVLAASLSAPWLLDLAATALRGAQPTVARLTSFESTTEIGDHLLAGLIPAAVKSCGPGGHRYSQTQVHTWLRALAQFLDERKSRGVGGTEFSLAQVWHLAGSSRVRRVYGALTGAVVAILVAAIYGLTTLQRYGYPLNVALGVGTGIATAAIAAPTVTLIDPDGRFYQRLAWRVPARSRWALAARRAFSIGLATVVALWVILWCLAALLFGTASAATLSATTAAAVGIGSALISWAVHTFTTTPEHQRILGCRARRLVRDDALTGLWVGLAYGAANGSMLALGLWKTHGTMWRDGNEFRIIDYGFDNPIHAAVTHGVCIAVVTTIGTAAILGATAGRHAVATLYFRATGNFAPRPCGFLEWACAAGLLSVTGPYYSIRHETLQDWLLRAPPPSDTDRHDTDSRLMHAHPTPRVGPSS